MVVKPLTFVVVAALLVVAAGTGAFLAVRQSQPAVTPVASQVEQPATSDELSIGLASEAAVEGADSGAVEATEAVLEEPATTESAVASEPTSRRDASRAESADDRAPPQRETRPARSQPVAPAPTTEVARAEPTPASAPRGRAHELPEVEGWTRPEARSASTETPERPEWMVEPEQVVLRTVDTASLGTELDPEPRPRIFEELVISADSVIGLQIETPTSTEHAEVEDQVEARVTRDVLVADQVAVPAGTRALGSVVLVEQAGQLKGVSRLGVRFHTIVMDDGVNVSVVTETLYREGKARGGESAAKIGGAAVAGSILGAIFGGGRGAAIGGAAGGTAAAMAGDAEAAQLPAGATVTVRLSRPATVTVER